MLEKKKITDERLPFTFAFNPHGSIINEFSVFPLGRSVGRSEIVLWDLILLEKNCY